MSEEDDGVIDAMIADLRSWTDEEREAFMDAYKGAFCIWCGSDRPNCQCWNDE